MNDGMLVLLTVLMTILGAFGSLCLKKGAAGNRGLLSLAFNPWFDCGGVLYFVSALLDIWLLKHLPYVVVLPLSSLTYVWSMLLARAAFGDRITGMKILGLVLIGVGVVILVV